MCIKKMRCRTRGLIRKTKEERGFIAEEKAEKLSLCLLKKGSIKYSAWVATSSFMNRALKIDKIWHRATDGKAVPLQFKSSQKYADEFQLKFKGFFERRFGSLPVIIVIEPGTKWEDLLPNTIEKVNSWNGRFEYKPWQVKYSKFFDFEKYSHYGTLKNRKNLFFKTLRLI